jgi:hypothetical protein
MKGGACGILFSAVTALCHSIFTTMVGGVLPVSVMITCAFLIHHKLFSNDDVASQENERKNNVLDKRDQQVLFMLLAQMLIFVTFIKRLFLQCCDIHDFK